MRDIIIIAHNIRSTHNVGSLFRTGDGLGITKIFLTGYTPYPEVPGDPRLPHIRTKLDSQIHKTALGAHHTVPFEHREDTTLLIETLKSEGYSVIALEQAKTSIKLQDYAAPEKIALLLGEEVEGIDQSLLKVCNDIVEIPMYGQKESFNVSVAAAMALYRFRFY